MLRPRIWKCQGNQVFAHAPSKVNQQSSNSNTDLQSVIDYIGYLEGKECIGPIAKQPIANSNCFNGFCFENTAFGK